LKRQTDRSAPTVQMLAGEFIERYAKRKKKTWRADEVMLHSAVLPDFGTILARDIKRRDVVQLVDRIASRAPVQANRILAVTRKMFAWAVEQEIIESSPCVGIKPPGAVNRRDRVLSDDELRALWLSLASSGAAPDVQSAVRLQLLTGQRIGEVAGAHWREFDFAKRNWTIPASRSKNGRVNIVPLTDAAIGVLEAIEKSGEFVFPRGGQTKHLRVDVTGHELGVAIRSLGLEAFGTHDLRRTVATRLAELRIPRVVVDALLNHVDRSVGAIYDRHSYADEKRGALETWARRLKEIVTGKTTSSVVELKRRRK
jgi:integrase